MTSVPSGPAGWVTCPSALTATGVVEPSAFTCRQTREASYFVRSVEPAADSESRKVSPWFVKTGPA